jgi:hypothetical protein
MVPRKTARGLTALGKARRAFWKAYIDRFPAERTWGPATALSYRWHALDNVGLVVSFYIARNGVGVFIRGTQQVPNEFVYDLLLPHADQLGARLGGKIGAPGFTYRFWTSTAGDFANPVEWPRLMDWLHSAVNSYEPALKECLD